MWIAVIPAKNEEGKIGQVLRTISRLPFELIVPVMNGTTDGTLDEVLATRLPQLHILFFAHSLGIDVPRAIGAHYAAQLEPTGVIFVDADMVGDIGNTIQQLMQGVEQGADMALTNCYPFITNRHTLANRVLKYRGKLNRELGLFATLGLASPSHGPHAISRRLLRQIPLEELAVPPVAMALAQQEELQICVASAFPHIRLGSEIRNNDHAGRIAHTIIGDCIEALHVARGLPRRRSDGDIEYIGYDSERRKDIVKEFLSPGTSPFALPD